MSQQARRNAGYTTVAGFVLLAFGLGTTQTLTLSEASTMEGGMTLYNSWRLFYWMLQFGGGAMIVAGGICFAGIRFGLLLSGILTGLCGIIMAGCAAYWISFDGAQLTYLLYLLFGVVFLKDGFGTLKIFKQGEPGMPQIAQPAAPIKEEPPHPAGIHPDSLPNEGEAPPPDGYLAALSKEEGEPPTASHE